MSSTKPQPNGQPRRTPRRQRGTRESLMAIVLGFEAIVVGLGALTLLGLRALDFVQALVGGGLVIAVLIAGALLARFTVGLVLGWIAQAAMGSPATVRFMQGMMGLCIVAGVVGVWFHYSGNTEFELEMYPTMAGWELFKESMMGATPALAPGAMVQLGLIGLAWSFRHPALERRTANGTKSSS